MNNPVFAFLVFLFSCTLFAQNQELSLAWETNPRSLDPRYANDANGQYLMDLSHCSLITFDPSGNPVGQVAQSWEWLSPTKLLVTVRSDAKFQDAKPVLVDDILATYKFLMGTQARPSPLSPAFRKVTSVRSPAPQKIEFELSQPDSSFVNNLFIGILPKDLASGPMLNDAPALKGCGPFQIDKIGVNDYTLIRNENYSLGPKSKLSKINIKIIKDDTTRFSKLLKGELDLVQNGISRDKAQSIAHSHSKLAIASREGLNVSYVGFNFRDPILAKKEVRQAISLGINREEIIRYLLQGLAEPARNFLSSGSPFRDEVGKPVFDLNQAKTLLDKAGFPEKGPEKLRFSLDLKTTADNTRLNVAQAIAGQLRKLGIKVQVQALEWGKLSSDLEHGAVQMWVQNWVGYKDPDIFRYTFASESFPPHGGNRGWYSNTRLDKLLLEGLQTTDFAKRRSLYIQAQKIVEEDLPYAFLWHEKNFVVYNKAIKGFQLYADGRYSSLVNVSR